MSVIHAPWDASLAATLDALRIDVSGARRPAGSANASDDPLTDVVAASLHRHGFALLSGLAGSGDRAAAADALLAFSSRLGTIVPQSPRGDRIEDVRDFSDVEPRDDRGYRSRGELSPHSDPPTLILLHCLRPARSGGESHIVNVRAIHDRIAATGPDALGVLYGGFPQWRVEGQYGGSVAGPAEDERPIFAQREGAVSCVHYRPFTEQAAAARGAPLTPAQVHALDTFDACANAPDLALRFAMLPGETLLLHNRTVLHARTDYEDWPEPERRRHLLRVWIDAPERLPVAPAHELGDLFAPR